MAAHGRPPMDGEQIAVRVPSEQYDQLVERATRQRRSMASVVREALDAFFLPCSLSDTQTNAADQTDRASS